MSEQELPPQEQTAPEAEPAPQPEPAPEPPRAAEQAPVVEAAPAPAPAPAPQPPAEAQPKPRPERREQGERREPRERGPKPENRGERQRPGPERGPDRGGERPPDRGPGRDRDRDRFAGPRDRGLREGPADIELEKLIADSLYLDNQAHAVVARMRDMDSGTRSQLRRFYSAVRRATRAPESERQHQFVMLRARLAYTIARHQLRSLDTLERLLLQVTRKNAPAGYERFRDLFEAIVAYNE